MSPQAKKCDTLQPDMRNIWFTLVGASIYVFLPFTRCFNVLQVYSWNFFLLASYGKLTQTGISTIVIAEIWIYYFTVIPYITFPPAIDTWNDKRLVSSNGAFTCLQEHYNYYSEP